MRHCITIPCIFLCFSVCVGTYRTSEMWNTIDLVHMHIILSGSDCWDGEVCPSYRLKATVCCKILHKGSYKSSAIYLRLWITFGTNFFSFFLFSLCSDLNAIFFFLQGLRNWKLQCSIEDVTATAEAWKSSGFICLCCWILSKES